MSCDTVVSCGNRILEKPKSSEECVSFLEQLSHRLFGRFRFCPFFEEETVKLLKEMENKFVLNFKITERSQYVEIQFVGFCKVFFGDISDEMIEEYAKTEEPFDKAGGYGSQSVAGKWIEGVEGDYNTVVGLPLHVVCKVI